MLRDVASPCARRGTCALLLLLALTWPRAAGAQGTARSLDFESSIRAAGMGGASTAVWGRASSLWSNPALLATRRGLQYERGRTQLVPGLAENVYFNSRTWSLAGGGAGVTFSGAPFAGIGGLGVDYGVLELMDAGGNVYGTYRTYEDIDAWGFASSLLETAESAARLLGADETHLDRWGDIAFGLGGRDVYVLLAPGFDGSTTARDWGLLLRVPLVRAQGSDLPLSVDASLGMSVLGANDAAVAYGTGEAYPVSRHRRKGMALTTALRLPASWAESMRGSPVGCFASGMDPWLSATFAWDLDDIDAGGTGQGAYRTTGYGLELAAFQVLALRVGHYADRDGDIVDATLGVGVALPLGRYGGVRYDHARWPQASGLEHVKRNEVGFWLDPVEVVTALRRGRARTAAKGRTW